VQEVIAEGLHEITADPVKYAVELAQFAVLVVLIKAVAFGIGKRRGFVTSALIRHQENIVSRLEAATQAEEHLASAQEHAAQMIEDAREEASRIVGDAGKTAKADKAQARADADAEADSIRAHAQRILDDELAEMNVEVRDRLVDLVARATRSVLNEGFSSAEQRELIQKVVSSGIDRMEYVEAGEQA
jgi:F-type H+-transporting ATPase subunit b